MAIKIPNHFLLRQFAGVHLLWICINVSGICILLTLYYKSGEDMFVFVSVLLSIPLFYYGSYLLAITGLDFRFMYPATLTIQIVALTYLIFGILHGLAILVKFDVIDSMGRVYSLTSYKIKKLKLVC